MKYLADTHMHSIYSYDGQMCLEDMVRRGIALGLQYMAFTEHLELDQIKIEQFLNRYSVYSKEIAQLQEKYPFIHLLKGIEFSNPERYKKELEMIQTLSCDYVIGSNHILPGNQSKGEILKYYKRILEMVRNGGIDSVGHLDYLRRKYDDSCVDESILREIYGCMLEKGITLEVNTSAIRRKGLDSFPSRRKLQLYKDMGGCRVTIGSDAHRLHEIYDSVEQVDQELDFDKGIYVQRKFLSLTPKK